MKSTNHKNDKSDKKPVAEIVGPTVADPGTPIMPGKGPVTPAEKTNAEAAMVDLIARMFLKETLS